MEEVDELILGSLTGLGCSLGESTTSLASLTPQQILRNRYGPSSSYIKGCGNEMFVVSTLFFPEGAHKTRIPGI